ncbi:MAG: lytic transglycosylase domain-containing protein [Thermoanaerobaculales bacterium]|jgi:hypothetical protein|nr:lytic transglycosylase domain-containing protein [Thermoanaerobaculales bacterium]
MCKCERGTLLVLFMVLLIVIAAPTEAEIVAFADGRILKAEDAYLEGEEIVIELPGGGVVRVPATRVDRVVADEVEENPAPIPELGDCPWKWDGESLPDGIPFAEQIAAASKQAGIHPWLLVALVRAESNFDPLAVSRAGAHGLTQLMPVTAADRGVTDVFDPEQNLTAGAVHLKTLLDRFESLTLALAAYNAGPATVERYDGVPPYRETRDYVRKVTTWYCGESS